LKQWALRPRERIPRQDIVGDLYRCGNWFAAERMRGETERLNRHAIRLGIFLFQLPRKEIERSLHGIVVIGWQESMTLVGIDVAFAGKVFHPAELKDLLRIRYGNVVVVPAVQNQQRRHALQLVKEFIGQAAVLLCYRIDGNGL
jgi:hypothetical protein